MLRQVRSCLPPPQPRIGRAGLTHHELARLGVTGRTGRTTERAGSHSRPRRRFRRSGRDCRNLDRKRCRHRHAGGYRRLDRRGRRGRRRGRIGRRHDGCRHGNEGNRSGHCRRHDRRRERRCRCGSGSTEPSTLTLRGRRRILFRRNHSDQNENQHRCAQHPPRGLPATDPRPAHPPANQPDRTDNNHADPNKHDHGGQELHELFPLGATLLQDPFDLRTADTRRVVSPRKTLPIPETTGLSYIKPVREACPNDPHSKTVAPYRDWSSNENRPRSRSSGADHQVELVQIVAH